MLIAARSSQDLAYHGFPMSLPIAAYLRAAQKKVMKL
jgi:hypothetical protein